MIPSCTSKVVSSSPSYLRHGRRPFVTQAILSYASFYLSRAFLRDGSDKLNELKVTKARFENSQTRVIAIKEHILTEAKKGNFSSSIPNFEKMERRIALKGLMLSGLFAISAIHFAGEAAISFVKQPLDEINSRRT